MAQAVAGNITPPPQIRNPHRNPAPPRLKTNREVKAQHLQRENYFRLTDNGIAAATATRLMDTALRSFVYKDPNYYNRPLGYIMVHQIAFQQTNDADISHRVACYMNRRPLNYQPPGE